MAERDALVLDHTDNVVELPLAEPSDSLRRLARTIRRARERQGRSLRNLAEAASVNHEAIRRIEAGTADPRWTVVARLALVLGLNLHKVTLGQIGAQRAEQENESS